MTLLMGTQVLNITIPSYDSPREPTSTVAPPAGFSESHRTPWFFTFGKPPSPVREKPLQPGHIAVDEEPPEREPRPVKQGHRRIEQAGGALRGCAFIDHDTVRTPAQPSPWRAPRVRNTACPRAASFIHA